MEKFAQNFPTAKSAESAADSCGPHEEITFPPELARDADAATVFLAYPLEAMVTWRKTWPLDVTGCHFRDAYRVVHDGSEIFRRYMEFTDLPFSWSC